MMGNHRMATNIVEKLKDELNDYIPTLGGQGSEGMKPSMGWRAGVMKRSGALGALNYRSQDARNLCEENIRGKVEWREEGAWMPEASSLDNFVMEDSCFFRPI